MKTSNFPARLVLSFGLILLAGMIFTVRSPAEDVDPFQKRINDAIARGRDNLLGQIPGMTAKLPGGYPMGRLSLPLAAALKGAKRSAERRELHGALALKTHTHPNLCGEPP